MLALIFFFNTYVQEIMFLSCNVFFRVSIKVGYSHIIKLLGSISYVSIKSLSELGIIYD